MPFQIIAAQRLYQQVADQIGALIRRGEFPPGKRLPPERDLARVLGVSRPVVREAMIALEIAGLVEVRTGSGTYVRVPLADAGAPDGRPAPTTDPGPSPFDLIRARILIEGEIAFQAATAASAADLDAIAGTLDALRRAMESGGNTLEIDRQFHTRIAASTGNSVLVSVVDGLWDGIVAPLFNGLSRHTGLSDHHRMTLAHHARIAEALRRRDGDAARTAMRDHLGEVESVLLGEEAGN